MTCIAALADIRCSHALQVWFTAEREYKGFSSPPLQIHAEMLKLHKSMAQRLGPGAGPAAGKAAGAAAASGASTSGAAADSGEGDEGVCMSFIRQDAGGWMCCVVGLPSKCP